MTGINVRIWMMQQQIKANKIAQDYGCTASFVSKFLKGEKRSKGLVDYLIEEGCPEKNFKNGKVAA